MILFHYKILPYLTPQTERHQQKYTVSGKEETNGFSE